MADHYCTLADVNALVPHAPFTGSSRPTAGQVVDLIETIATQMDGSLKTLGYATPIATGDEALKQLRQICSYGVLGIAQSMRSTNISEAVGANGKEAKNIWEQRFESLMKQLADDDDPFRLLDAPETDRGVEKDLDAQVRTFVDGLPTSEFDPDCPAVTRSQVF